MVENRGEKGLESNKFPFLSRMSCRKLSYKMVKILNVFRNERYSMKEV